jgi:hypothetical protein
MNMLNGLIGKVSLKLRIDLCVVFFRAGASKVPPEQFNRYHAGAAIGKVLCPPASCVGSPSQWLGKDASSCDSRTGFRKRCQAKQGQTPFERSPASLTARYSARLGYRLGRSKASCRSYDGTGTNRPAAALEASASLE